MDVYMKITKEGDDLVLRIPLSQKSYDACGDYSFDTANLIGVIAGNECSISQLIDLGYKGDQQEGGAIINFDGDPEGLKKVCKELDIDIWEHPICTYPGCKRVLRGCMGYGDNGVQCTNHEHD